MALYCGTEWCASCKQMTDYYDEGEGVPECGFVVGG